MQQQSFNFEKPPPPAPSGDAFDGWLIHRRPANFNIAVQVCVRVLAADDPEELAKLLDVKVDGQWFTGYVVTAKGASPQQAIRKGQGVIHGG